MILRIKYIINVIIVFLLFSSIAIQKSGALMGTEVSEIVAPKEADNQALVEVETVLEDGTRVIDSAPLANDIIGFGGRTPVYVYVKNNRIEQVKFQPNDETPDFFEAVVKSGLADKWKGMTLEAAASAKIDAVSGATYTSEAIIGNVQKAAQYGSNTTMQQGFSNPFKNLETKEIIALIALASGALITLLKVRRKAVIIAQMLLNVIVLGFWCGSFLSLSALVSWCANGVNLSVSIISVTMLIIVLVMPLLGRKGSYCHIHCPMGSAQEIMRLLPFRKVTISGNIAKALNNLRYYVLIALLFVMWCGVGFDLMDYEVFSAFIYSTASTFVLVLAAVFLLLSVFVPRPYCRFICPTGALISMTQKASE